MKLLLLLAALVLSVAEAQPTNCTVNAGVPPTIRYEGLTEQIGNIVLTCTGGTPAAIGSPVPQSDITVYLNTNVTSRILSTAGGTTWVDALVLIDEPHSTANPNVPLLACGDPSAPDSLVSPGVCSINGTGNGSGVYSGATNRPNVWQGRLTTTTSITWLGVPIDAPPSGSSRTIRITNIRVAPQSLGVPSSVLLPALNMAISIGGANPVPADPGTTFLPPINNIVPSTVAYVSPGISPDVPITVSFQQGVSNNASLATGANYANAIGDVLVRFQEGFQPAFSRKNWGYAVNVALEQNQNIPGAVYNTESGFENIGPASDPSPNPPDRLVNVSTAVAPTAAFPSYHGLSAAGVADSGTRLMLTFAGVPAGVSLFVPTVVPLVVNYPLPQPGQPQGRVDGYAYLVSTDSSGVGSNRIASLPGGAIRGCSSNITNAGLACPTGTTGLAQVVSGVAVYEVYSSEPFTPDLVSVPVAVAYTANPAGDRPVTGLQTTVTPSFAPLSSVATASSNAPQPRFIASAAARNLFTITKATPSYAGFLDTVNCQKISGWVADKNRLNQSITVSIYDGMVFLANITAAGSRADVGALLGDNGLHGFTYKVPASLHDGGTHNIHVVYETNSTMEIVGSPRALAGCGPAYTGYIDSASCTTITGWIGDTDRLNVSLTITLWDGTTQIASTTANLLRADVGVVLGDQGFHGFRMPFPVAYLNGVSHSFQLRYEASSIQVPGSPATLNCGSVPTYTGYVDSAACSGISGWIADRTRLNQPLAVTLWDGSTQSAFATANLSRGDVGSLLGDNGLHGFSLAIPVGYANGVSHTLQVRYENSAEQVPGSPVTLTCGSSGSATYAGYIDSASCSGISGWVADRNRLNQGISVTLWDGVTQIATTTASLARPDVGVVLGDNGLHGFRLQLPPGYANGVGHSLQLRYESSATQVPGSPFSLTCGSAGGVKYVGYVDAASCNGISGWAADTNRLNQAITVSLWDGATQLISVTANTPRSDVGGVLGDNGLHGFMLPVSSAYADGISHTLQVRFETSSTQLPASPVTIRCGGVPNYTGYVDTLNCSTIGGWAADKNNLTSDFFVFIYDGTALLSSRLASEYRGDVGVVLGDNGFHGFSISTPPSVKDGKAHTIRVLPGTGSTVLPGLSSLTCPAGGQ